MKKALKLIKHLGNLPANVLSPIKLAEEFDTQRYAYVDPHLVGLSAVGGPRSWLGRSVRGKKEGSLKIALVGKGITFDSGGISIKPANGMQDMKFDMLGAATVLGVAMTCEEFNGELDIYGCCAENVFRHDAMRPGDVITYPNGIRAQIDNTDAEGRLVLADGILEAIKHSPDLIITIATLTGAAKAALGAATALFSNSEEYAEGILKASVEKEELLWRLPLWDIHRKAIELKSPVADITNSANSAGASTAAAFLEKFVGDTPWLHLDIAGSAYNKDGPTGAMLKTLTHFLMSL